jgi:hypothetical protein
MPKIEFFLRRTGVFGSLGAAMAILMFLALFEVTLSNWRGDTTIWVQPLATLVNCLCWLAYGLGKQDWFVVTPQLFGIVLAVATLVAAV